MAGETWMGGYEIACCTPDPLALGDYIDLAQLDAAG
jgi:hypothetical protein